jgi:membrane protein implicated in regulation of membrane protease activity
MLNATMLLQWHYLIFLLPMGIAALLLLLSSLRLGHHGGHGGHHVHGPALRGHTPTHAAPHAGTGGHSAHAHASTGHAADPKSAGSSARQGKDTRPNVTVTNHLVLNLTGANRAPLAMILEAFLLIWGVVGLWAHQLMAHAEQPSPRQILLLVSIALVGGVVGARVAASVIGRFMPQDETLIVSRNELIGLTGTIVFAASQTSGRIHVYDTFGTLHDEMCRVAPGHLTIEKGRTAMVLDMDTKGNLLVEELV